MEKKELEVTPRYRTKSVERALEEVDIAYSKYGRKSIFWADPTFNIDPRWTDEFCGKLIKRNYKDLHWYAYLRVDYLLRDERLGVLEKMVRSGMAHALIGIERASYDEIARFAREGYSKELVQEVFSIFKRKYPQVITQGTFLAYLPYDTKESMVQLINYGGTVGVDFPFYVPLVPFPGTAIYQDCVKNNLLSRNGAKKPTPYDSITAEMKRSLPRLKLEELRINFPPHAPFWQFIRGIFSPFKMRRNYYRSFFLHSISKWLLVFNCLLCGGRGGIGKRAGPGAVDDGYGEGVYYKIIFLMLKKPKWYDS